MAKKCFVISPIGLEGTETRARSDQIFSFVIKPAVEVLGYEAIRGDQIHQPGMISSQVIEHLMDDEIAIADLTGKNPNVYYELAIRHVIKKPVIHIKDVSESLPFDVLGMRTIDVDYRFIQSMERCKQDIIKQIKGIESSSNEIETPITFTERAKSIDGILSELVRLDSEIKSIKQMPTVDNKQVNDLTAFYNNKILEAIHDLPKSNNTVDSINMDRTTHRVLWVDDFPSNNKTIMDVYRHQGVEFDLALDTVQALDSVRKNSYQLIISDISRGSEKDAGICMIQDIKKAGVVAPIFIYASDSIIKIYGKIAKDEGATIITSSARDLVINMNEILKLR